jgi:hypothetical protein
VPLSVKCWNTPTKTCRDRVTRPYVRPTETHRPLNARQLQVLRERCQSAGRGEAATRLGKDWSEWNVGRVLRSIECCADDAMACWEHRVELEAVKK